MVPNFEDVLAPYFKSIDGIALSQPQRIKKKETNKPAYVFIKKEKKRNKPAYVTEKDKKKKKYAQ